MDNIRPEGGDPGAYAVEIRDDGFDRPFVSVDVRRGAKQAARTGVGRLAIVGEDLPVDDGGGIASGSLFETPRPGPGCRRPRVASGHRPVRVKDRHVGRVARRESPPVLKAPDVRRPRR